MRSLSWMRRGGPRAADSSPAPPPDFFRGEEVSDVALASLDHAIVATAANDRILLRVYNIAFRKSGTRVRKHALPSSSSSSVPLTETPCCRAQLPRVELDLMGPSMDLSLRRTQQAPPDLRKQALKRPAGYVPWPSTRALPLPPRTRAYPMPSMQRCGQEGEERGAQRAGRSHGTRAHDEAELG